MEEFETKIKITGTVTDITYHNDVNGYTVFVVDSLAHLKRGGRVSATTAIVGSLIGIKGEEYSYSELIKIADKFKQEFLRKYPE